jgi:hypothetical protein
MSITMKSLNTRLLFQHELIQRSAATEGLKPRGLLVADCTGATASGFPTRKPVRLTAAKLDTLCAGEIEVVYADSVPNALTGEGELHLSARLTTRPHGFLRQVLEGTPETAAVLTQLDGLYALREKLNTALGRPVEREIAAAVAALMTDAKPSKKGK